MEKRKKIEDEENIRWHNAFCAATELELSDNADVLDFHPEYILGKEPIKIDMLVVRVKDKVSLKNEIAKDFFRGYNVMEYKSPGDGVNIDTLYKTIAYAALYKAETGEYVDTIRDTDITMTIVREEKPVKLFDILKKEKGCKIMIRYEGIYEVSNLIFPLQIVVGKELNEETHIWLKSLTRHITVQRAKRLARQYRETKDSGTKQDQQNAEAVVDLVSRASNIEIATSVKEDGIMTIMDVAGSIIEEERRQKREAIRDKEAAIRSREAAIRSREAAIILGIRNMAKTYLRFKQSKEDANNAIIEEYPDTDIELINSIISEIYGGDDSSSGQ